MIYQDLFKEYERLAATAAAAFERVSLQFNDLVRCRKGCADCCHAAFGLFPVEAAYLRWRFSFLERKLRRSLLKRCDKVEKEMEMAFGKSKEKGLESRTEVDLSHVRLRCPLLSEELLCDLYQARPITCVVYGIPTRSGPTSMVCPRSGFTKGMSYPTFDLGFIQGRLYELSIRLMGSDLDAQERARLLVSVATALRTPLEYLLAGRI